MQINRISKLSFQIRSHYPFLFKYTQEFSHFLFLLFKPGLEDGKVRALSTKLNKSQSIYETQSMVVSLAANERGTGFICGHDDGSIIRYYISEESGAQVSGRIIQHQTTPVSLAWANSYIITAGCDRRITFYDSQVSN